MLKLRFLIIVLFTQLSCSVWAQTRQVEGISFEEGITIDKHKLVLNGIGLNQQLSEKISVLGLYLPSKQTTSQGASSVQGAKRIELVYLRKVSSKAMSRYLMKAMRDSDEKSELLKDPQALADFGRIFDTAGDRAAGDRVTIDWIPGRGMEMKVGGKAKGEPINSEALYRLLINSVTGPKAKEKMRDGLLGTLK